MVHYKTISEWFEAWQLPKPEHPLISVVKTDVTRMMRAADSATSFFDFRAVVGVRHSQRAAHQQPSRRSFN